MIKSKLNRFALIALAGTAMVMGSANAAPVVFADGDLVLGFRSGASSVYQFNLGSSISFRDNGNLGLIANIGTDLVSIFGSNWYSDGTLYMGIAGVRTNNTGASPVSGDPAVTIYTSKSRSNLANNSTAPTLTPRVNTATLITSMQNSFKLQNATANSSGLGAEVAKTVAGDWSEYMTASTDFTYMTDIEQKLDVISSGTFAGVTQVEGALDLYRILNTTTGASPSGTVGTGSRETTIVIRQNGDIYAVPEPSTYALLGLSAVAIAFVIRRRNQKLNA